MFCDICIFSQSVKENRVRFYFLENLMIEKISRPVVSTFKWGAVFSAISLAVVSFQVSANSDLDLSKKPNVGANSSQDWSPSAGFADLIERVSPAVVHVGTSGFVTRQRRNGLRQFRFPPGFGFEDMFPEFTPPQDNTEPGTEGSKEKRPLGIGSGFIISSDGYVVTNHHVIDNADEIIVTLTDGVEYVAEVKGSDPKTDVALLKLEGAKDLPYVSWGNDEKSRVGDWVLAIGNPFGLGGSASTGIISARGRDINSGPYDDFIQVDAAINRGNSGGPLFNTHGEVIGINTAIYSPNGGSVGIGFSIPSNLAKNIIGQLERSGAVERAWIGIAIQPLDDDLAEGFGREDKKGALISSIQPNAPADKAGLKAGDIILSYDGTEIKEMRDLPKTVAQSSVGEKHKVVIWRDGRKKTISITTEPFPEEPRLASQSKTQESPDTDMDEVIGAQLSVLSDESRSRYRISSDVAGVLVVAVEAGGLAAKNGLRRGDVISALNGIRVNSPSDILDIIKSANKKRQSTLPILLSRGNDARFMPFRLK